jgi:peptidoglycan-N-acetylglucosamine deacetylase
MYQLAHHFCKFAEKEYNMKPNNLNRALNYIKRVSGIIFLLSFILPMSSIGQPWNGYPCAVVLTYDDGLNVHLDKVIPALDAAGLKGTFYAEGRAPSLHLRMDDWRKAAASGHELGNHTLFHPCAGSPPGRSFVSADFDLDTYTVRRITEELRVANTLLKAIDGKEKRTFAYTCGDRKAGDIDFTPQVKSLFPGARGVASKMESPESIDLYNVGAYMINGQTGEQMIGLVKEAQQKGLLLVFLFHGVGGEHNLDVSLEAHNQLVEYLKENRQNIWVPTMLEAVEFLDK